VGGGGSWLNAWARRSPVEVVMLELVLAKIAASTSAGQAPGRPELHEAVACTRLLQAAVLGNVDTSASNCDVGDPIRSESLL
jgi:hypothetical protein